MAAKYLTMVGQLQWLVTLGRFDIHAPCQSSELPPDKDIWTDSREFTPMPLGLRIMQLGLDLINLTIDQDFDWTYSVYGNVQEILPDDMPEPLGKAVTATKTMDANLNHLFSHW